MRSSLIHGLRTICVAVIMAAILGGCADQLEQFGHEVGMLEAQPDEAKVEVNISWTGRDADPATISAANAEAIHGLVPVLNEAGWLVITSADKGLEVNIQFFAPANGRSLHVVTDADWVVKGTPLYQLSDVGPDEIPITRSCDETCTAKKVVAQIIADIKKAGQKIVPPAPVILEERPQA